jgi:hypothetical protein
MTRARRLFVLVTLGAAVLALSLVVIVRNKSPDDELLAIVGILGALAIILVAATSTNGKS